MLTKRGKDYLKSAAVVVLLTSVAGPPIAAGLALSLSITAAFSFLVFSSRVRTASVRAEETRVRTFKGTSTTVTARTGSLGTSFARLAGFSLVAPFGVDGEVSKPVDGTTQLKLRPRYAGAFEKIALSVRVTDALGIFEESSLNELDLALESLPTSLLTPYQPVQLMPLVEGENPTGRRGFGQELYSVEPYAPGMDARDVMWKRASRSAGEFLQVKTKEASVRNRVLIAVMLVADSQEERVKKIDLVTEAIASIGKRLIELGVTVSAIYVHDELMASASASNLKELADATVYFWAGTRSEPRMLEEASGADIVIVGPEGLQKPWLSTKVVLVVFDGRGPPPAATSAFSFSGSEDLTPVVMEVLGR